MIDPKPLAAFLEYTVRPVLQDSCELLERMEKSGLDPKIVIKEFVRIMLYQMLVNFMTTIIVTGAICSTLFFLLMKQ